MTSEQYALLIVLLGVLGAVAAVSALVLVLVPILRRRTARASYNREKPRHARKYSEGTTISDDESHSLPLLRRVFNWSSTHAPDESLGRYEAEWVKGEDGVSLLRGVLRSASGGTAPVAQGEYAMVPRPSFSDEQRTMNATSASSSSVPLPSFSLAPPSARKASDASSEAHSPTKSPSPTRLVIPSAPARASEMPSALLPTLSHRPFDAAATPVSAAAASSGMWPDSALERDFPSRRATTKTTATDADTGTSLSLPSLNFGDALPYSPAAPSSVGEHMSWLNTDPAAGGGGGAHAPSAFKFPQRSGTMKTQASGATSHFGRQSLLPRYRLDSELSLNSPAAASSIAHVFGPWSEREDTRYSDGPDVPQTASPFDDWPPRRSPSPPSTRAPSPSPPRSPSPPPARVPSPPPVRSPSPPPSRSPPPPPPPPARVPSPPPARRVPPPPPNMTSPPPYAAIPPHMQRAPSATASPPRQLPTLPLSPSPDATPLPNMSSPRLPAIPMGSPLPFIPPNSPSPMMSPRRLPQPPPPPPRRPSGSRTARASVGRSGLQPVREISDAGSGEMR